MEEIKTKYDNIYEDLNKYLQFIDLETMSNNELKTMVNNLFIILRDFCNDGMALEAEIKIRRRPFVLTAPKAPVITEDKIAELDEIDKLDLDEDTKRMVFLAYGVYAANRLAHLFSRDGYLYTQNPFFSDRSQIRLPNECTREYQNKMRECCFGIKAMYINTILELYQNNPEQFQYDREKMNNDNIGCIARGVDDDHKEVIAILVGWQDQYNPKVIAVHLVGDMINRVKNMPYSINFGIHGDKLRNLISVDCPSKSDEFSL